MVWFLKKYKNKDQDLVKIKSISEIEQWTIELNEFVEIYNASTRVIQINGWTLSDGNGVDTISHLSGPIGIAPNQAIAI